MRAEVVSDWRPMSEAPQDGRPILAVVENTFGEREMAVIWWEHTGYNQDRRCWAYGPESSEYGFRAAVEAICWMPLPEPPAAA